MPVKDAVRYRKSGGRQFAQERLKRERKKYRERNDGFNDTASIGNIGMDLFR